MNGGIAKAWSAALRSGKYAQGTNVMRSPDGARFDALGVLCDLYDPNGWSRGPAASREHPTPGLQYKGSHHVLPGRVMEWAGLADPRVETMEGLSLAEMNDNGSTFEQLADVIDAQWKVL